MNMFWGDQGANAFTSKVQRLCPEALQYWLLNIVEQNRSVPGGNEAFAKLFVESDEKRGKAKCSFDQAISHFLYSQWHDELSWAQLDQMRSWVKDYLQRTLDSSRDAFSLIDVQNLSHNCTASRSSCAAFSAPKAGEMARLKIRGLRNRGGGTFEEDAQTMKEQRRSIAAQGPKEHQAEEKV